MPFATATSPSAQARVADKVYLSSFVPLNNKSVWDGHVSAFLRPLPLDQGKPDFTSPRFLWDAGNEILNQAPTQTAANSGDLELGTGVEGGWELRPRLRGATTAVRLSREPRGLRLRRRVATAGRRNNPSSSPRPGANPGRRAVGTWPAASTRPRTRSSTSRASASAVRSS